MKVISGLRDLEPYGVVPLTGEACSISARILCDLTKKGAALFRRTFGLDPDCKLAEPWNRGRDADPHVAAVMLAADVWKTLGLFALLFDGGCRTVYTFGPGEAQHEKIRKLDTATSMLRDALDDLDAVGEVRSRTEICRRLLSDVGDISPGRRGFVLAEDTLYGQEGAIDDSMAAVIAIAQKRDWTWRAWHRPHGDQCVGDRNIHQMSGRVG